MSTGYDESAMIDRTNHFQISILLSTKSKEIPVTVSLYYMKENRQRSLNRDH